MIAVFTLVKRELGGGDMGHSPASCFELGLNAPFLFFSVF